MNFNFLIYTAIKTSSNILPYSIYNFIKNILKNHSNLSHFYNYELTVKLYKVVYKLKGEIMISNGGGGCCGDDCSC